MPGPSPGGSPERETGAGGRPRGPGRDRRVRFRLPHTAIALPSVREEERLFYRRLEALAVPGPGGFGPLFVSDAWSDLTEDRLLRKRVVRAGPGGSRPLPGQEVSVKVLGALEDGGLVERDPRLIFVPGHGDVVQVSPNRCAVPCRAGQRCPGLRPASPAVPVHRLWSWASPPCSPGRLPSSSPLSPTPMATRAGDAAGGAGRPRPAAAAARRPPAPGLAAPGAGQLPLRTGRLRGGAAIVPAVPERPGRPRHRSARARGGRGVAGAAREVPQQLRGRRAEAGAGGGGAGGLRGGPADQPRQQPGVAPPRAAAGRAGPGRRGGAHPEESPGAGPGQQGHPHRALTAGEAPEPRTQHRPAESPPRRDAAAEPRIPRTAHGGRSDLSGPAAPQSLTEEIEELSYRPPRTAPQSLGRRRTVRGEG
ncbi:translation initiation factor IF-2-like isoform X1 [Oenanthe melanoleuca]|uniref:translation initiation factor IF-2-like isoform X1 n=1 Tax=Oenanthe melanoleuca TaxID=2939378 RepID=UPI0024C1594F|nr:translation initiation factor IF-2-like isoform X1 [Oenanthe melanoleuca]